MAKDYFEDIIPPSRSSRPKKEHVAEDSENEILPTPVAINTPADTSARSIRNISVTTRQRSRPIDMRESPSESPRSRRSSPRIFLWGAAVIGILVVGALLLVALRPTRVDVTPRTHTITFGEESFAAAPVDSATGGTLSYTVQTIELEDSEVVASDGVVYGEDKATGNITVYNNYQDTPLKLIKNTRFATASGLIFRTPAEVIVPAKKGSTAGKIQITVVADQPGDQYNVPAGKLTLPGLKSTAAMYAGVYAESTEAFSGGFVGERPGVAAGALEAAISAVRARLEVKARESVAQIPESSIAFLELAQITYQSQPNTTEAGGGVRVHQKAIVSIPTFARDAFIAEVGRSAIGSSDPATIRLVRGEGFGATSSGTAVVLGTDTLSFGLAGSVRLVWDIPTEDLQRALAGKDRSAFESIAGTFTSIQEARARIEPFWKDVFPADPTAIKIVIGEPEMAQ